MGWADWGASSPAGVYVWMAAGVDFGGRLFSERDGDIDKIKPIYMADQEVVKHVKAAIAASRDKNKSWKHKLQEILLEVGIIVFAVSLSIWLHGWAEDRKDHQEEREFLLGLRQDLQADVKEMMGDRDTYSYCLKGVKYFERVGAGGEIEPRQSGSLRVDPG